MGNKKFEKAVFVLNEDITWSNVLEFVKTLIKAGYECKIYAEADSIIIIVKSLEL